MSSDSTAQAFRDTHPRLATEVRGDAWEYVRGGGGSGAIAIVGGGGSTPESMFAVNEALETSARVISVGIPATVSTESQVAEGLRAVLDSLGVRRAIFLGHSLGGLAAQAFALNYPERVAGLVLANTGFYLGARAILLPASARLIARMPAGLLAAAVNSQMSRLLRTAEKADFWREFYRWELSQPGAGLRLRGHLALLGRLASFFHRGPLNASLPWTQSTPVQIIASEDDRGFTPRETAYLASLYPKSRTALFPKGTGHVSFLTQPREYIEIVKQFAARCN